MNTAIRSTTLAIIGEEWGPNDLRHTAAQRMVDAGASAITLAEFMGHSSIRTGQVYYDTSPTQAQKINDALAISPIYSRVAEIARTRVIDIGALSRLPQDQQIGGVPHGIPIAGIGGCGVGQSNCQKNPILACYGCRHFMALQEPGVHRAVVNDFYKASRGDGDSLAFSQLRGTLEEARKVVEDIESWNTVAVENMKMQGPSR